MHGARRDGEQERDRAWSEVEMWLRWTKPKTRQTIELVTLLIAQILLTVPEMEATAGRGSSQRCL